MRIQAQGRRYYDSSDTIITMSGPIPREVALFELDVLRGRVSANLQLRFAPAFAGARRFIENAVGVSPGGSIPFYAGDRGDPTRRVDVEIFVGSCCI